LQVIDADECVRRLPFGTLVPALADAFTRPATVPERHNHPLADGTLLLMPAWSDAGYIGVKWVNIFPNNVDRSAVSAAYLLASAKTGEHLVMIDGNELTRRRTIAVAALAASRLARADARTLLVVGAGHIGSIAAPAYASVRDIRKVLVYSRRTEHAAKLVGELSGFEAEVVTDLPAAVAQADIISCATLAEQPVVRGAWLRPGTHVDLIGSFRPSMHEVDDVALTRAEVFIDTEAALHEAGELVSAFKNGVLDQTHIRGTLGQLCAGEVAGRRSEQDITIFKTVGTGLADLAAAALVYARE
jgi:ornithine cyclodeaminase